MRSEKKSKEEEKNVTGGEMKTQQERLKGEGQRGGDRRLIGGWRETPAGED